MKTRKKARLLATVMALAVCVGLVPQAAFAADAGITAGTTSLTVASSTSGSNTSVVAFAGHEWWVIGANGSGVYSAADDGAVTLFSKNDDFGYSLFRNSYYDTDDPLDGYSVFYYTGSDGRLIAYYCYADNPDGMAAWNEPGEYAGSTLQQAMEGIADGIKTNSEKEYKLILARTIAGGTAYTYKNLSGDGIAGQSIADQKLWALSIDELDAINNVLVVQYGDQTLHDSQAAWYWLRTPSQPVDPDNPDPHYEGMIGEQVWLVYPKPETVNDIGVSSEEVDWSNAVRPALSFDASNVLFSSAASDTDGKGAAAVGSALVSTGDPTGALKYTFKDSSQTVTADSAVEVTSASLKLTYSGAATGTNQYVSCLIKDASGNLKYYGKLANCTDASAASGEATVTLPSGITTADLISGTYALYVFSEQANGSLYSDFAGELQKVVPSHVWGEASYEWADDNSSCTATHICSACGMTESETAKLGTDAAPMVTYAETKPATSTETGIGTYTATFSVAWATTQTKDVPIAATLPQTGDSSNLALWIGLLVLAAAGLTGAVIYGKKHGYSR